MIRKILAVVLVGILSLALAAPASAGRGGGGGGGSHGGSHHGFRHGGGFHRCCFGPGFVGGVFLGSALAYPFYSYPYYYPYYYPYPYAYPAYSEPVYQQQQLTAAPSIQREVCYVGGCYHLQGDGVTVAYQWIWVPTPPAPPPGPPSQ